jgi:UbiD family decarboxylase
MPLADLREWIDRVDALGELSRIDGADTQSEIGGLTDLYQWDMGNPALLFDRIKGYPAGFRVLSNVLTSLSRIALTLDLPTTCTARGLVDAWRGQLDRLQPLPVQEVENGPIFQNRQTGKDVDVTRFPAPVWHSGDGSGYLGTGCIVISQDPDTGWINSGTYRVAVHDSQTLGLYISPGKHGRLIRDKYWKRDQSCPVAISFGHDPLLLVLGGLEIDYGVNEFDVAGGIRGQPLAIVRAPVTGLPVPPVPSSSLKARSHRMSCVKKVHSVNGPAITRAVANRNRLFACNQSCIATTRLCSVVFPVNRRTTIRSCAARYVLHCSGMSWSAPACRGLLEYGHTRRAVVG